MFASGLLRSLFLPDSTASHYDALVALITSYLHGSPTDALLQIVPLVFYAQALAIQKIDGLEHEDLVSDLESAVWSSSKTAAPQTSFVVMAPLDTVVEDEEESEEEGDVVREATAGRESMPDVVPIPSEVEKEIRDDEDKVEGEKEPSVVEAAADAIHNPRGVAYYVLSTLVRVVEAVAAVVSSEDLMMYCKSVEEARAEEAWDANCSEDRVCDSRSVFLYKETVVQFIVRSPLLLSSSGGGRCGV